MSLLENRWWYIFGVLGWLALATLVYSCETNVAYAHDDAIINCSNNIKYAKAIKLNEERLSNGLLDEHYDSNEDGVPDIHVLSSILGASNDDGITPHRENPVFWVVDLDFDGREDAVYIDLRGEGNCGDIVLYRDLNAPVPDEEPRDPIERKRDVDKRRM